MVLSRKHRRGSCKPSFRERLKITEPYRLAVSQFSAGDLCITSDIRADAVETGCDQFFLEPQFMIVTLLKKCCPIISLAIILGLSSTVQAEEKLRLNFGVYSSNKPSAMVKVFRPVLKQLETSMSARLGREVDIRMQIAKDYDQGISHLVNGRVDFSHFGPASYVEAKRMNKNISIIAVENKLNSKVSWGIIAIKNDSPVTRLTDLKGKSFAFGDEGSTIGRFLSQLELEQAGIRAVDLSRYEYLGRHDKVGTAVGAGAFDAGALNEKTFKKLVDNGVDIKELVRFPNVSKPWIARSGIDPEVFNAMRDSLLSVTDKATLAAMKIDGFLEGSDADYSVIRKAMENNHVFFADHDEINEHGANVSTQDGSKEPSMQAATRTHTATEDEYTANSRTIRSSTDVSGTQVVTEKTASKTQLNARTITLNIELPASLFQNPNPNSPDSITINVKLPEAAPEE